MLLYKIIYITVTAFTKCIRKRNALEIKSAIENVKIHNRARVNSKKKDLDKLRSAYRLQSHQAP